MVVGGVIIGSRDFIIQQLRTAFETASQANGANEEIFYEVVKLFQQVAGPLGIALLVIGIFLFVTAIICFVGICCHVRVMVIIYAIIVGVIALAHIILVIVYFSKKDLFLTAIYDSMRGLTKNYKSIQSGEAESITFGMLMSMLECCGFNDATDFNAAGSQFAREDSYNGVEFANIQFPLPCCRRDSIGQNANQCPQTFTAANSNIQTGCKQKIYEQAVPLLDKVMLGSLVVLAVESIYAVSHRHAYKTSTWSYFENRSVRTRTYPTSVPRMSSGLDTMARDIYGVGVVLSPGSD
ncbi:tetraspanin-CD63 receptor [Clonorchis sinensis]|uniref:Tetraspanin-CD63 receptor n=1 Tax=Clonorchis sinensis TaxID=79923 RepID=G7Y3M0_CLOSI|nr:tetraspanin-CD63 receptor [Clonorchis sinensis]